MVAHSWFCPTLKCHNPEWGEGLRVARQVTALKPLLTVLVSLVDPQFWPLTMVPENPDVEASVQPATVCKETCSFQYGFNKVTCYSSTTRN